MRSNLSKIWFISCADRFSKEQAQSGLRELIMNPAGFSTAVEDSVNQNNVFFYSVINGKRKLLCQQAIIT